jgi:hypothetical protein
VARAANYSGIRHSLAGDLTVCQSTRPEEASLHILYRIEPQAHLNSINQLSKSTTETQNFSIYLKILYNLHTTSDTMSFFGSSSSSSSTSPSSERSSTELKNALIEQVRAEAAVANTRTLISVRLHSLPHNLKVN